MGTGVMAGDLDYIEIGRKGKKSLDQEDDPNGREIRAKETAVREMRAAC